MSLEVNRNNIVRCCSFCRTPGHNITRCNNPILTVFEEVSTYFIRMNLLQRNNNIEEKFREFLLNRTLYTSETVRAFAIRKCGSTIRSTIDNCIEKIIEYHRPLMQQNILELEQETQSQLESNLEIYSSNTIEHYIRRFGDSTHESVLGVILLMNLLITEFPENESSDKFNIKLIVSEDSESLNTKCECNICYEEYSNAQFIKLDCGHKFCKDCFKQSLQNERKRTYCCAFCRNKTKSAELYNETTKEEFNDLIL